MSTLGDILYEAVDGSFAIDCNQRIIYWDAGCEELLGYSEKWVLGRTCYSVLNWCNAAAEKCFCHQKCTVAKLSEGGKAPKTFLVRAKDKNDQALVLSVSIILVPSSCKSCWHVMHLLHRDTYPDVLSTLDASNRRKLQHNAHSKYTSNIDDYEKESRLTAREYEILELLSEGISGSTIAKKLNISTTTVRNHIQHIENKLGVHSKTEAVAYAYRHNFL